MNSRNLTNYYAWGTKALVFVIPFLSYWISRSLYFPYITGRNFLFRILIEIAFALWIGLVILNKEYRPKLTPIIIGVLAFVAIVGIANLLGVDPYNSFWSRLERMEGYMMILHIAAYFVILTSVFRTKKEWIVLWNIFVIVGILVGFYGVLQLLGIREAIQGGDVRIDGTIGNPTYLAAYLTLVIAAALILLFNSDKKGLKYFYGATVLFFFFTIFFTATRGAALSFLIAIPLFLVLYLIFFKGQDAKEVLFRKIAIGILAAMIILPAAIFALKNTSVVQNSEVLSRLTSVSLGERTIKSRFLIWGIAWKAFQERPILGWGQENFLEAFSKYYDPRLYDQEPWFDRPHNIVFEWLINAGVLGLAAYLALFAVLYLSVFRAIKSGAASKKEGLVLLVVPVAYFLQNFFVFDNFNTYILFFGLLAYVNRLVSNQSIMVLQNDSSERKINASLIAAGAGLLLGGFIIYFANAKPMIQAKWIINSLIATTQQGNAIGNTLDAFKKTLSYDTFAKAETLEQLARTGNLLVGSAAVPNQAKIPFLQFTITELENYLKENPRNIRLHLMLASLYQSAQSFNSQLVFNAREHIQAALELSPDKQQIIFLAADNYLATNEIEKAIELLQKAAALEMSNREAHINLATVGILLGRETLVNEAIENLNAVRLSATDKKNPPGPLWAFIADLKKITQVYLRVGQRSKARSMYNRIGALGPDIAAFQDEGVNSDLQVLLSDLDDAIRE